mmetsp:Transcript_18153/g.51959  ORF Transcript_18153/g.51959 Transcript_18153/m.51959 type:complete len:637 (-) Transcript_18153:66-1976(-)
MFTAILSCWVLIQHFLGVADAFISISHPSPTTAALSVSAERRRPGQKGYGGRGGRDGGGRGGARPRRRDDDNFQRPKSASTGSTFRSRTASGNTADVDVVPKKINGERLSGSLDCEHFGKCPGCVVDERVADTEIVRSAKRYFSSPFVRKNRLDRNQGAMYDSEEAMKDDGFYRVVVPSPLTQWRTQAKLAVAPKSSWGRDGCIFGLYERGTHDVLPIPHCVVHHPSINRAIEALTRATERVGTAAYNENTGEGGLRYVQCQVERSTGLICLTVVWNAEKLKETQPQLSRLIKELKKIEPRLFHSIWCHCNDSAGNAIFARGASRWHPVDGPDFIREPIAGTNPEKREGMLYFSPQAFRQGNLDGFDNIAQHVANEVPGGSKVCELYAGVGVLGLTALSLRAREAEAAMEDVEWFGDEETEKKEPLAWLRCSDENPNNPRCFNRAVGSMPTEVTGRPPRFGKKKGRKGRGRRGGGKQATEIKGEEGMTLAELMAQVEQSELQGPGDEKKASSKVSYLVASAAEALHKGQALGADVLIVDPPRKGLEDEVLVQLCKPPNPNQDYTEDPTYLTAPRHTINWANDVRKLIYVSCGFDALARDSDRLLSSGGGGWKLEGATGYVLFPGSNHVETVAIFNR